MQAKITKRTVDTATADSADLWIWDAQLKGFGLRVRPNGHKTYVVEYRPGAGGRGAIKRRYTIGRHGSPWTADTARTEAERILGLVRNGSDPVADKTAHKAAPTVKELGERFLKEHADTKRKPATAAQYRRLLDQFINPAMGRRKVADVTRQDVMKLHTGLHDTPYQANRVLALISTLFTFAERVGERPDGTNPARHVERYKEEARERMLSADELACLGEALTMIGTAADKVADIRARLASASRQSISRTRSGSASPSSPFTVTVTPLRSSRWTSRLAATGFMVERSRVSSSTACCSASSPRPGFSLRREARSRLGRKTSRALMRPSEPFSPKVSWKRFAVLHPSSANSSAAGSSTSSASDRPV